ncbi:hypothetical protein [Streptomyces sp. SP17KL33]|uniref:hypothetical protein n=1 Tax=Streptomyces sp. SP17KL33 TaxID=3002534 RepID=UPI002E759CCB|nr:hypothetical protein [Streptomyces sp. SP17KL33]MEE1833577.1 hypothetical protein [Streptomyces sp. SP17KL33]
MGRAVRLRLRRVLLRRVRLLTVRLRLLTVRLGLGLGLVLWLRLRVRLLAVRPLVRRLLTVGPLGRWRHGHASTLLHKSCAKD